MAITTINVPHKPSPCNLITKITLKYRRKSGAWKKAVIRAKHIYIRERSIVGGVKNPRNCRGLGASTFLEPLGCLQHVKYRYYVFIIMRSWLRPIEQSRVVRGPSSVAEDRGEGRGRGIINLSLQVPPRIYIHEQEDDSSVVVAFAVALFAFSAQSFAPLQIAALKLDANFPSIPLRGPSSLYKES